MHVTRLGLTPVKGGRHRTQRSVLLAETGPVGDRTFCLVDPAAGRCLRTVENPRILQTSASWEGEVLSVELPSGRVAATPVRTGEVREVDYWGRTAVVELVEGPWAAAYSAFLGREVVLATSAPGEVVYGGSVTIVTDASLTWLGSRLGAHVDGARFRATVQLGTDDVQPHAEHGWIGRRLRLGTAEVRVRGLVPRCAVVDLDPATGVRDLRVLRALAEDRGRHGDVVFGVDADVVVPGQVSTGDPAVLIAD